MKALHLGKSFSLLLITDLNTALLVERSSPLTAITSYISSASVMLECWQNLSKLTNQRVYQILVYRNDFLLGLPTGVLSLSFAALFFIFSRGVFCTVTWLTERLEEANFDSVSIYKHAKKKLGKYPAILTSHLVNNLLYTYNLWYIIFILILLCFRCSHRCPIWGWQWGCSLYLQRVQKRPGWNSYAGTLSHTNGTFYLSYWLTNWPRDERMGGQTDRGYIQCRRMDWLAGWLTYWPTD